MFDEVWIVVVKSNKTGKTTVSQEGYTDPKKGIDFIESRSDEPQRLQMYSWLGTENIYSLKCISVIRG